MLLLAVSIGLALLVAGPGLAVGQYDPRDLALALGAVGPRIQGSPGYTAAQELLQQSMAELELESVGILESREPGDWMHLRGLLRGESELEILLTAHYDTTAATSGLLDNASGCAATLGAIVDLDRTPRQHSIELIFTDREETSAAGSREWLATRSSGDLSGMLAHFNIDMVGGRSDVPGILHLVVARGSGGRRLSPAWLVHATLQGAAAADFPLAVLDERWSWFAQLAIRLAVPTRVSDADRFLAAGVPSVTLSDLPMTAARRDLESLDAEEEVLVSDRLEHWGRATAAAIRRVDGFLARPADETEYLVVGGRVLVRRDLLWLGFLLWVLLVWRGLPGRWRRETAGQRRRTGLVYLPGFVFRMAFLLAVFLIPAFATLLLYPVAGCALVGSNRSRRTRQVCCALGVLPTISFALWLTFGQFSGWFVLDRAALLPATVVLLTVGTFCTWQLDPSR